MKKILTLLAAAAITIGIGSCSQTEQGTFLSTEPVYHMNVNEALENAPHLIDSIVSISGQCVHICDFSNFTCYLMGKDSVLIRCVATGLIGGAFPDSLYKKNVEFEGMLRDQHLTVEGIHNLDEQYKMHMQILRDYNLDDEYQMLDSHRRCEYERKFRHQEGIVYFDESTADYRKKIEERIATEGKDFLTYYNLEVTAYKILD